MRNVDYKNNVLFYDTFLVVLDILQLIRIFGVTTTSVN